MRSFTATLGGKPVRILAPEPGSDPHAYPIASVARETTSHLGLDVEGTYMDDLAQWSPDFGLRLLQLAPRDDLAYVLTLSDPAQHAAAVATLADRSLSFVSHTGMDVLSSAVVLGVDITARNVDTRSLAQMAHPEKFEKRDLKDLANRYGMPELAEAEEVLNARFRELWPGRKNAAWSAIAAHGWSAIPLDDPAYLTYAGLDAIAARILERLLVPVTQAPAELIRTEVWLTGRANRIQLAGMLVDQERLAQIEAEAGAVCGAASDRIVELTEVDGVRNPKMARSPSIVGWFGGHGVDWSSWQEHGGALTKTGNPSLADDNVEVLKTYDLDEVGAQVAVELATFKGYQDRLTKAKGVRSHLSPDGRIHPSLNPGGATTTGRMSSAGPNAQNFAADMRGVLIPDPGHVLASVDFDQVEMRVVAAQARETPMIETILAGGDLHQLTADRLGIPRKIAKPTNFLIVYGGGAGALHSLTGLPLDECREVIRAFYSSYTSIDAYRKYLGLERDAVRTISRRRLPVTYFQGEAKAYANINFAVQSAARELLVDAWLALDAAGYGGNVWFPIHDELVLHARQEQAAEVIAAAERAMRFDYCGVPISASGIVLRDADGVSRWMDGHDAEEIAGRMGWTA